MRLEDLRDYIADLDLGANLVYANKMPGDGYKMIGVYRSTHTAAYRAALGSLESYDTLYISVLVHWTTDPRDSEAAAQRVYEAVKAIKGIQQGESEFLFAIPIYSAPVPVGVDEEGVVEYVIEAALYYRK